MKKQLPNILTILRILLTPVFIVLLFYEHPYSNFWALVIFVIASITDAYDGYVARKYDLETDYGRFLDPLADKILVSSAFISFAVIEIVPYWMVGLIIFRDLFVTGLRMLMNQKGFIMQTSKSAKIKTGVQIGFIIFVLVYLGAKAFTFFPVTDFVTIIKEYRIIYYLTITVTVLTLLTGINYLYMNRAVIKRFFD
jgi:CDP-diacylglycerol--glycerol-3-phosphate 3-phosphatidyltransferase